MGERGVGLAISTAPKAESLGSHDPLPASRKALASPNSRTSSTPSPPASGKLCCCFLFRCESKPEETFPTPRTFPESRKIAARSRAFELELERGARRRDHARVERKREFERKVAGKDGDETDGERGKPRHLRNERVRAGRQDAKHHSSLGRGEHSEVFPRTCWTGQGTDARSSAGEEGDGGGARL